MVHRQAFLENILNIPIKAYRKVLFCVAVVDGNLEQHEDIVAEQSEWCRSIIMRSSNNFA
jgi:hypothetical protein